MNEQNSLKLKLELMWWVFTAILAAAVLAPIYLNNITFPFYVTNIVFIVVFVTVTRYVFLLKHTWLVQMKWLKIALVVGSVIVIFVLSTSMIDFNNYLDEVGLQEVVQKLPADKQFPMIRYMQREVIFFGVGGIVAMMILPVRMLISLRRMRQTIT
ncbi:MAG: hypothetical protein DRI69_10200 [Bacteroidetes bacterium]|nr:MAG: hypothetical protein DRI69_10200 [Bacteroidota bacterium]